jgi:hypothetical protein
MFLKSVCEKWMLCDFHCAIRSLRDSTNWESVCYEKYRVSVAGCLRGWLSGFGVKRDSTRFISKHD